jgi:histone-lysine N-methyltransferase SUV420H
MVRTLQEGEVLPHPAEDLSADDDLLSWILVDQLGCLPNTKLGVHPQQVKFVGPVFKTSEILAIVQEVSNELAREVTDCRLLSIPIYLKLLVDC